MKIAVLGASGATGKQLVKQALAAQHEVVAVVRNPDSMKELQSDKLKVVKGDVFSEEDLKTHFAGAEAVFSCLGFKRASPVTGYTDTIKPIVGAARASNINRLVVMTAYYTETSSADSQGMLVRWLVIPMLRPILTNMREMEKYLETNCTDINYTVVRPPGLTNDKLSDNPVKVEVDGFFLKGVTRPSRMPRANVAKYMLDCLPDAQVFKKALAIGI